LSSATFVALFVAALVVLFILKVIDVLLLVFLAILLAVYLSAITDWLERRFGMRRWLGLTLTVLATVAGVASVAALLAPPVVEQTRALIGGLPQTLTNIQNVLARWASQYPVLDQTELANPSSGVVSGLVTDAFSFLSGSIFGYVRGGGMLFIEGASVVVMALYLARQPAMYRDGMISLFAPRHRSIAIQVFDDTAATLRAWVVGQLIAAAEVNEDLSGDSLIKQFQGIEVKANADEQLLALKRKMGLLPGGTQEQARALGKGAKDAELLEDDDAEQKS